MRAVTIALVSLLAAPFSLLAVPAAAQAPLASQGCLGCHGPLGEGAGAIPALAGRPAAALAAAMAEFRAGTRPASIMDRIARGYTEAEIAAIAAQFAALPGSAR